MEQRLPVLLAIVLLAGCTGLGNNVSSTIHQTVGATGLTGLRVDNTAGTIDVRSWNRPAVELTAVKTARDQQALNGVNIDVARSGSTLDVTTRYAGSHTGGVRYTISMPGQLALGISNTAGIVRASGLTGDVAITTEAGTIDVSMHAVKPDGSIVMSATTGTIRLSVPARTNAVFSAHSSVGAFDSDFDVHQERTNLVGVRADATLGSGGAHISLSTGTGAIALRKSD